MEILQFINQLKASSDEEAQRLASSYGIALTLQEIKALRPLLDEISFHWLFSGVPESFIAKVKRAVGEKKGEELFRSYLDMI
ncbi:hypothetical protein HNO89_002973 [Sporosarcina luteola]|nr:hypothetical protein [Sporosarcina luteola]